jgi:Fe-S-cluster containining protein
MIRRHLEPWQEQDPGAWFDAEPIDDADYPSGKAIGTRATERGCVFLDSVGRCALQKAAVAEGMDRFALKPFYCVAYPVVIENGVLMISDLPTLDAFDVCAEELEFVLGKEGVEELRALAERESLPKPEL